MITKRQLGWMLIATGVLVAIGVFAANLIGAVDASFGPFQRIGLIAATLIVVIALPLLRLGDRPA